MKTLDLNDLGVQEMNAEEIRNIEGGEVSIIVIEGLFDGVKGNEHMWIFGQKIF